MKHYTLCTRCFKEKPVSHTWAVGEIQSSLVAICTCPKGHKTIDGLMHDLMDVLYTSGVHAYLNDCFSESVMSFAVSLEQSYALFIRAVLLREGVSLESIDELWKEIGNQSERLYGAFCSQFLRITCKSWKVNQGMIKFRNKVIHKGYIVTSNEAKRFAEYITKCHFIILNILKKDFSDECKKIFFYQKEQNSTNVDKIMKDNPGALFVASAYPSLLKWNNSEIKNLNFSNILVEYKNSLKIYSIPIRQRI